MAAGRRLGFDPTVHHCMEVAPFDPTIFRRLGG